MVGAPTPALVSAQAELIPGYFTGDGCSSVKQVSSAILDVCDLGVGDRIKCGDDIGTIRYVGEVVGYSGLWYGVEWDEPSRGRHSGSVDGVQYFRTRHAGAGSFVRPHRAAPSVTLADAIRKHYADREDEVSAAHRKCAINEWKREMGAPFIEMVGFDRVSSTQGRLEHLECASVRDSNVRCAGPVGALCPSLRAVDAASNLFRGWREVIELSAQLPALSDLDLSKNRLEIDLTEEQLKRNSVHFLSLKKLNLSHCDYDWADILTLANLWPNLDELIVAHNRIDKLEPPAGVLETLTVLRLDGNDLEWSDVLCLGRMKNLKLLSVNDCGLANVRIDRDMGLFPNLEVLLLNRNRIADWGSVSALAALPALKRLYFLKNPLQTSEDYGSGEQAIVATLSQLQELNGCKISAEMRRGAEYDYLKRHGAAYKLADPNFHIQHPTFKSLVDKYGLPEDSLFVTQPKHTSLTSKLIEIHLKDEHGNTITKKFPSNMMVQKLATLAQRLFSCGKTGPPELYCLDEERGNREIHLDNDMKDLNYFSVRSGDTVLVRWR